jgi:prepilin signal peptidase PulO-like enzyme (type II secretory pathway)
MIAVYAAAFGLAFGSFANAAIDRLPDHRSLSGRSCCDGCGRALRPWELVPVLSYAVLRGRCATCHASIGLRSPLVEAASAAVFASAFAACAPLVATAVAAATQGIIVASGIAMKRGVQS